MNFLILALIIVTTSAAVHHGGPQYYTKYYNDSDLFLNDTFIRPRCKIYTSRQEFLKRLNMTSADGYDVEHIIDEKHSMFSGCNKNIYGNIILANSSWNRALGIRTWKWVSAEKEHVYGSIFIQAKHNVRHCCEQDDDVGNIIIIISIIYSLLISGILFMFLIFLCVLRCVYQWMASNHVDTDTFYSLI